MDSRRHPVRPIAAVIAILAAGGATGCVKSLATGAMADALSSTGGVYGRDDDPELVRAAVPFGLKTMEGVLVEEPEHVGLLTALASGFVQYGVAFVEQDAHRVEDDDYERALALRRRARRLYERARGYGLRALEVRHEGFTARLKDAPEAALQTLEPPDVPQLYWTAAAWGSWIGASNLEPAAIAQLPTVRKMAERALTLDPAWNDGSVHELFIALETAAPGGDVAAAKRHYEEAVALSGGRRAGTHVSYAENVCVRTQDVPCFVEALKAALAIDVDAHPEDRLANVIMQRRAERLLARGEDLFLEFPADGAEASTVPGDPGT